MLEVIRHEGGRWVLYSHDGSRKLGEFDSEEGAQKRERQIQFFKHQAAFAYRRLSPAELVEAHSAAWHRCWDKVKRSYNDRSAAAICTWSVQRAPNPPDVYESLRASVSEASVVLSLDDAADIDDVLSAEMELRGLDALVIDTDSWEMQEIRGGELVRSGELVPDLVYTAEQESCRDWLMARGLLEVGSRHTRREFEIITQVIALMRELYGEVDSLDDLLTQAGQTEAARPVTEAANVADYLESTIHSSFTTTADYLFQRGLINRDERIALSGLIGDTLRGFSAAMDAAYPDLRSRSAELIFASNRSVVEGARTLTELVERAVAAPAINEAGNLSGIVLVEGRSGNGNVYTRQALESGIRVFAGRPIYADHPSQSEMRDRPERSIRDLVGRLPVDPGDLWVAEVAAGPHAGKMALHYRNGRLSETAGWLATLIREGIAGDQSINAVGMGRDDLNGDFVVEAFDAAISLDFVTTAAAGGRARLTESAAPGAQQEPIELVPDPLPILTVESLAEARPDIVDIIAARERRKAYGEKQQLVTLQEANRQMSDKLKAAREAAQKAIREKRKVQAEQAVTEGLAGLPEKVRPQVRRLVESQVRQFVEQMEVPEISLPSDVQALPEEAQAAWLKAYMEGIGTGAGEEAAAASAWVAVFSSWEQDEAGNWKQKAGSEPPAPPEGAAVPGAPMTMEGLKAAIAEAANVFRQALASAAGAGVSGVPAPNPAADDKADEQRRIEQYKRAGFTEAEAKIAVRGRM